MLEVSALHKYFIIITIIIIIIIKRRRSTKDEIDQLSGKERETRFKGNTWKSSGRLSGARKMI